MSMVARMKEQFKGAGGVTPEQHKIIAKSQKEKEEQAVLIAKARAARYNLTLRTADLQSATATGGAAAMKAAIRPDQSKIVKGTTADDYKSKKAVDTAASADSKPNPFKVNLKKVGAPPSQVAEALHFNRNPSVAKAMVEVAAQAAAEGVVATPDEDRKTVAKSEAQVVVLEAKTAQNVTVLIEVNEEVAAVFEDAKVPVTADMVETLKNEDAPSVVGQEFEMSDLKKAVESNDQAKINEAIVTDFLETHAPEMVPDVPSLLKEYKGNEAALMEKLADEHPDPAEKIEAEAVALITGETAPTAEEKKEIEEVHQEEVAKNAQMSASERAQDEVVQEALVEHAAAQDASLKEDLAALREAVQEDAAATTDASATEGAASGGFIFSGVNTDGQWQVNVDETAAE